MEIVITDFAKEELKNIYDFYKFNVNAQIAIKIRTNIIAAIKTLKPNPFIG